MADSITRVTLFVPGTPSSLAGWNKELRGLRVEDGVLRGDNLDVPVEAEWIENDGAFGTAFSFGTVEAKSVRTIDRAPGALVLHCPLDLRSGRELIVATVERLRDAGALAVRLEQSKLGWEISRWLELFSANDASAWHRAAVTFLSGDDEVQSCGMHAFSLPDVRVPLDIDADDARALGTQLNLYQITEDPMIRSGQTFAPDRETPKRVLERWPDTQYAPSHACHNPYGVWRMRAPGGAARRLHKLESVFVPSLAALLTALEAKAGKPLTKKQVLAARDGGACIAMEPRDARALEHSRGYADLDPELAWEQWTALREATD